MYHSGWSWWWMGIGMALFWIVVGMGIWFLVRSAGRGPSDRRPEDILAERYAHGELSTDEFETQRRVLRVAAKSHE